MRRFISRAAFIIIGAQISGGMAAIPVVTAGTMPEKNRLMPGSPAPNASTAQSRRTTKTRQRELVVPNDASGPLVAKPGPLPLNPVYRPFVDYVLLQHRIGVAGGERASAVLSRFSSLERPDSVKCGARASAAIIDADIVPDENAAVAQLADALKVLRGGGISVLWMADATWAGAGQMRDRLWANGGVGDATDRLLLKHSIGDSMQKLRLDAASSYCVVAIVGARKGDMDELFDYLRDPAFAYRFDHYWGSGWFIVPRMPAASPAEKDRNALDPR